MSLVWIQICYLSNYHWLAEKCSRSCGLHNYGSQKKLWFTGQEEHGLEVLEMLSSKPWRTARKITGVSLKTVVVWVDPLSSGLEIANVQFSAPPSSGGATHVQRQGAEGGRSWWPVGREKEKERDREERDAIERRDRGKKKSMGPGGPLLVGLFFKRKIKIGGWNPQFTPDFYSHNTLLSYSSSY